MISRGVRGFGGVGAKRRSVHRLALSPACWGISDVPDWGHQINADRVISEALAVGEGAITAGPPGFLPDHSEEARLLLRRHKAEVVAGKAHGILHHHDLRGPELAHIDGQAHWLAALGASTLVLSAIPERAPAAGRAPRLTGPEWAHLLNLIGSVEHVCARHRLKLAVQPMFGSTIQGPDDIERVLVGSEAGLCIDVAHLVLAGADPADVVELAAGRIQHVQLNDVDMDVVRELRTGVLDYPEGVDHGLYRPLGEGGAGVAAVVEALKTVGYRGWYTLEQETRLASSDDRPLGRISRSLEYLMPLLA